MVFNGVTVVGVEVEVAGKSGAAAAAVEYDGRIRTTIDEVFFREGVIS